MKIMIIIVNMLSVDDYWYHSLGKVDWIFWFGFLRVVKFVLWILDLTGTVVHGTSILNGTKHEQEQSKSYETLAHVVKVLGRRTICLSENLNKNIFLYLHESYQIKVSALDAKAINQIFNGYFIHTQLTFYNRHFRIVFPFFQKIHQWINID